MLIIIWSNVLMRWLPRFGAKRDGPVWFVEVKWLKFQAVIQSKEMANCTTDVLNDWAKGGEESK